MEALPASTWVQAVSWALLLQGIFATHLHQLLKFDMKREKLQYWCMETLRDAAGRLAPTMRMVPGTCTHSLALEVAAKAGLPQHVLTRAAQLYQVHPCTS